MPLHLLGKKSWNVYNSTNIERVRRDEADASAREEAEEQRLQLEDADRRIRILRGEKLEPVATNDITETIAAEPRSNRRDDRDRHGARKRRKLYGEDDTDRDIRWAKEDAELGQQASAALSKRSRAGDEIPLQDSEGHIQLVPVPDVKAASKIERNAELEAEKARKKQEEEDQYTMRFSNAAGYKTGMSAPWYAAGKADNARDSVALQTTSLLQTMPDKDVWGNEDPRRRERESKRVISNDPFAFMQQAQRQLKQSERDRDRWKAERADELRALERDKSRRRRLDHIPELDLDGDASSRREKRHHSSHRRHRDRRSASPSRHKIRP